MCISARRLAVCYCKFEYVHKWQIRNTSLCALSNVDLLVVSSSYFEFTSFCDVQWTKIIVIIESEYRGASVRWYTVLKMVQRCRRRSVVQCRASVNLIERSEVSWPRGHWPGTSYAPIQSDASAESLTVDAPMCQSSRHSGLRWYGATVWSVCGKNSDVRCSPSDNNFTLYDRMSRIITITLKGDGRTIKIKCHIFCVRWIFL